MPIYEYRCDACGHKLERLQRLSDKLLVECPECGKATLSKLVSAAGFQLKGSGWYVTDFRDGNKVNKDKGDSQSKDGANTTESGATKKDDKSGDSSGSSKKDDGKAKDTAKSDTSKSDTAKSETTKTNSASSTAPRSSDQ